MKKTVLALTLLGAPLFALPAVAGTMTIIDGGVGCESYSASAYTGVCDASDSDLSNSQPSNDTVNFLGSGTLHGYLVDRNNLSNDYPDYATVNLASDSILTMTLVDPFANFDATFTFGPTITKVLTATDDSITFSLAAGSYDFGLNAVVPTNSGSTQKSSYTLEVAAVPLPAGALLLLTGMGAFAAARRKT